ncbi:MAG TPA: hypothetical protein VEY70_27490 [Metabacillus sp.]|nr:hypothetical protein [Metabacillus sp.]
MDKEKKEIIIKEIYYWKDNKLLPDTYCDFLLALYTEGNNDSEKSGPSKNKMGRQLILIGIIFVLFLISTLVTYFTELSFVLQTVTTGFLLLTSIIVTAFSIRVKGSYQIALVTTFIQLLIFSLSFVEYTTEGNHLWVAATVVTNCLLWIAIGGFFRVYYLLICGVITLLFLGVTMII